jgi:hypothetical protein
VSVGECHLLLAPLWPSFFICYPLDFSNILTKTAIERLADADEYEAVREVQVISLLIYGHAISDWFKLTLLGTLR